MSDINFSVSNASAMGEGAYAPLAGVVDLSRLPANGLIRQTALRALLAISKPTEWRWRVSGRLPDLKIQGWYDCAEVRKFLSGENGAGKRKARPRSKLAA